MRVWSQTTETKKAMISTYTDGNKVLYAYTVFGLWLNQFNVLVPGNVLHQGVAETLALAKEYALRSL